MVDFETVKQVSILDVLRRYGVQLKGRGAWHYAKCPLPTHESKTNNASFAVNVPGNYWLCHSDSCQRNNGNKKGGDVINLVQVLEKCSMREAAEKLAGWYGLNGNDKSSRKEGCKEKREKVDIPPEDVKENKPLSFAGFKDLDPAHEYLRSRGIRITTAEEFGVGFFAGRSSVIKDPYRIVIPVHNASGQLVAYVGRSLDLSSEERYHFPPGFFKTLELFNLHRAKGPYAVVVEGFFGCMRVHEYGFPCVGLMGSTLSEAQAKLLERFESVILMLDGDGAGREATDVIAARLAKQQYVRAVALEEGEQPDLLSSDEIHGLLAPALR
jgi:DNA primase